MEPTSKERILKKIRKGLIESTSQPFTGVDINQSIYVSQFKPLDELFAEEFSKLTGQFIFCETIKEFIVSLNALTIEKKWENLFCWNHSLQKIFKRFDFKKCRVGTDIETADAGITTCEALIARTGTILLTSKQPSGRTLPIFPPVHIVIANTDQLVFDSKDALQQLVQKYNGHLPSMISLATGPSRTADIEKTLVLGAHGPKEVYVFLIDEPIE
jgi:L-lactate dehydrogenase complex protein LldG